MIDYEGAFVSLATSYRTGKVGTEDALLAPMMLDVCTAML